MKSEARIRFEESCHELVEAGRCKALCCGCIPIPLDLYYENEDKAQGEVVDFVTSGDDVCVVTKDLLCVFLNRATRSCSIYEQRPQVCRDYGKIAELSCARIGCQSDRERRWPVTRSARAKMGSPAQVLCMLPKQRPGLLLP